ncbi:ent-kaurenoic acid oxidase-like [Cornus florida]|uniref:ent-kaurenoic acid oxidase-like n=1 Tax=Cornus florida TaxID=4283 RepID=UPI0028A2B0F9|nr:ent-kaurenoic acid oxidase-like [Cornus florida]
MGLAWVLGVVSLVGWLLWRWNDLWYGLPVKTRCSASGTKLPPAHMGLPFFGEMLTEEHIPLSNNKNGKFITSDEISKMEYTNKVVEETIRLANISAFTFPTASKDVEYKDVSQVIKFLKTRKFCFGLDTSTQIQKTLKIPFALTRIDGITFQKPAKPGTYQVFGGGERICAGNMFARLQIAIFLHHLAIGYKWELVNPSAEMSYLPHPKPVDGVEIVFGKI